MEARTERTLELLEEIKALCREREIPYLLGGIPARGVKEGRPLEFPCLDLYVLEADLQRLYEACREKSDPRRELESSAENPAYPHEGFRYVDRESCLIDSEDLSEVRERGIHIEVLPLRPEGEGEEGMLRFLNADRQETAAPLSLWQEVRDYEYLGSEMRMPEALEDYYERLFSHPEGRRFPGYPNHRCIVSTEVSYEEVLAEMPEWESLRQGIAEQRRRIQGLSAAIEERDLVIKDVVRQAQAVLDEGREREEK